jgi:hypothetical protein
VLTYGVDRLGGYCGVTVANLLAIEPTLSSALGLAVQTCPGGSNDGYTVSVTSSSRDATVYVLSASGATLTRTCAPAGSGGCSAVGDW